MRISFDHQVFLLQEYGGISRYICSLARNLSSIPRVQVQVIAPLHCNRNLAGMNGLLGRNLFIAKVPPKLFRLFILASKLMAHILTWRFAPQIVHETYFSLDAHAPRGAKRVVTVYDMIHERYASMFDNAHMTTEPKRAAVMRADHVICISESTRRDVIELFGVPEAKTSVTYLAADEVFYANSILPVSVSITPPFLLYVGSRDGYKNFSGFLKAFGASAYLKENFSIVCFGGGQLRPAELAMCAGFGVEPTKVKQVPGDDAVLIGLYKQASAFVYPSLYEGFGIPPLEAMAVGCPVICSNTSSLPEVVGDAGEYFDPADSAGMTNAMERVLQSPVHRTALIEKGRQQCAKFSWTKCAEETLKIYRGLM